MGYGEHLRNLLQPLGIYDLAPGSLSGSELDALGTGLDKLSGRLDYAERESALATAESEGLDNFEPDKIIFTALHCGGRGGQNVNKVATGVRAVYPPSGLVVVCTEERSKHANRQKAVARLRELTAQAARQQQAAAKNQNWRCHTDLQRGNAQRVFSEATTLSRSR